MADPLTSSSNLIGVEMENRGQENLPVGVKFYLHAFSGLFVRIVSKLFCCLKILLKFH